MFIIIHVIMNKRDVFLEPIIFKTECIRISHWAIRFLFNSSTFALCTIWHATAVVSTSLQNIVPRVPNSELGEHWFRPGRLFCGLKVCRPMLKQVAALFPGSWVKSWWYTQRRKVGEPVTEVVYELDLSALSLWELCVCCLQSTPQTLHLFF